MDKSSGVCFEPPQRVAQLAHIKSHNEYLKLYQESICNPQLFFGRHAKELLYWDIPFNSVVEGSLEDGDCRWFLGGHLNASYCCVDRHAAKNPNKIAIMCEGDGLHQRREITYKELLLKVCQVTNYMKSEGLKTGDVVAIYMPMIPEAVIAMLACSRIGIVHSVVFAGFSEEALANRIQDAQCKMLFTTDQSLRGGKIINLKSLADLAILQCPSIKRVVVYRRTGDPSVPFNDMIDVDWQTITMRQRPYCPPVLMQSEDPLFILYTSGSTGKPKGVVHTHGGYLLQAALTTKYVFDIHPDDKFGCMADIGWITGHTYVVYGPLLLGISTLLFEGIPTWPSPARYWEIVEYWKLTQIYTAPTVIRSLIKHGDEFVLRHDRSSLRVLGSVGEPINPDAWLWYRNVVGNKECAVVDTYWQTETGSIMLTPLPGCTTTKPGSSCFPFFGIQVALLNANHDLEVDDKISSDKSNGNNDAIKEGVLCISSVWPSMARTLFNDHDRYVKTYLSPYRGYYFTGDGASCDADGYYTILGRVDDVINVSGHRLSTAEIENALAHDQRVAETACVGIHDELTGQSVFAFVSLKNECVIANELRQHIRHVIGAFAIPKHILIVPQLPKTRSGKILRRLLRKIAEGGTDAGLFGDLSTLSDPTVLSSLIEKTTDYYAARKEG